MIQAWRETWNSRAHAITNPTFPFGFVQLSTNEKSDTVVGGFSLIRWHQTYDYGYIPNRYLANVFMGVAMELRDDPHGIHPRTKNVVRYRLSRAALAIAYGQTIEYSSPIVHKVQVNRATIDITYKSVTGIDLRNTAGFEVCCESEGASCTNDNVWVPSPASLTDALTIALTLPSSCR
ncbi:unnamed protein product [Didymodactylos carnosus]|uniref:Uncharacterized protein n=1 Tax=Didymodactylos carnosus TaxID=1234261 RepID=A0A8S2JGC9_9BILA|nr:unnamed protein product [Didymodactylos carnosus]CAF3808634.1 unnamed protein product [Didymodactylos carnosus]